MIEVDPGLPGAEIVAQAFADWERHEVTSAVLGVTIIAPRLRLFGFEVFDLELEETPELLLYSRLSEEQTLDPYSAYNAMLRRLFSFAAAVEAEYFRARSG